MSVFYEVRDVPVHSVLLMPTRDAACGYRRGDVVLAFCDRCGFISNVAFDPTVHEYSASYEETQGFSPTFRTFASRLATHLIDRYGLRGKDILEIGCGKGEFIRTLCELGGNRGVGFDPAYVDDRREAREVANVRFVKDFYSPAYADYRADFVCCKMTLEHIHETGEFVRNVQNAVRDRAGAVVFFQMPDATRILRETAFWDIYYEHCSYFTPGSLARLFRGAGFRIVELWRDYGDQYLLLVASAEGAEGDVSALPGETLDQTREAITRFAEEHHRAIASWRAMLRDIRDRRRRAVIWGSGSKAVAFLTTLGVPGAIEYLVDVNPYKQGTFSPGTGEEIVAPALLKDYRPDVVIIMNPIYRPEIQADLDRLGLAPEVLVLGA